MGMNIQKEEQQREQALAREQQRQEEKQAKREALMNTTSYRVMDATAKYMDKYFLDPLVGLIPGGVGDVLSSFLALPFIYFALVQVRSIPLTLAVICNVLKDAPRGTSTMTKQLSMKSIGKPRGRRYSSSSSAS